MVSVQLKENQYNLAKLEARGKTNVAVHIIWKACALEVLYA